MKKKTICIKCGRKITHVDIYCCDFCGCELDECTPHIKIGEDKHVCRDCAFTRGFINGKTFLIWCGVYSDEARAVVKDGKIHTILSGKFPWENNQNADRLTKEYKNWRKSVFERDKYTCVLCGKVGVELNAHHIMPYAKYEELRFDLDNGITLCKECHKKIHSKKG